jgi:hypothetical protein
MKLTLSQGPDQGPAGTILVRNDDATDWPVITGAGGYGHPNHLVTLAVVDQDYRLTTWPPNFARVLTAAGAVGAGSNDPMTVMTFMTATAPEAGTISLTYARFLPRDYLNIAADAFRAAGIEVTVEDSDQDFGSDPTGEEPEEPDDGDLVTDRASLEEIAHGRAHEMY